MRIRLLGENRATRSWLSWPVLVGALTFLLLGTHTALLNDGDTYWHVAAGQWMLEHAEIPRVDPFSHSVRGAPWFAHEWLAELVFAWIFGLAGWTGLVLATAAAYGLALGLLCRYLLEQLEPMRALLFVSVAGSLAAPHILARPHALIIPLLVGWAVLLVRASETRSAPMWWQVWIPALWANLHGSFPFAVMLVVAFALDALTKVENPSERKQVVRSWAAFVCMAWLATLMTPHGLAAWRFVMELHGMSFSLATIAEWRSPDFHRWQPLELALLGGAAMVLFSGLRLPVVRMVLLLGLLHMALKHVRHAELFGFLAPVIVAGPFGEQWRLRQVATRQVVWLDRIFLSLARPASRLGHAAVFAVLLILAWVLIRRDVMQPAAAMSPAAAVQAVQQFAVSGPVFNAYEFGGYLIFVGIAPYIDARTDPYGDAFVARHHRAVHLDPPELLPSLLDRYQIGWTLLQPGLPAVALLDRLPGWQRVYTDATAVVHVRMAAEPINGSR